MGNPSPKNRLPGSSGRRQAEDEALRRCLKTDDGRFRNSTLQHLINPEQFAEYLKLEGNEFGELLLEVRKSFASVSDEPEPFHQCSPIKRRKTDVMTQNLNLYQSKYSQTLEQKSSQQIEAVSDYEKTIKQIIVTKNKFLMSYDYETLHKSVSYGWLLDLCCNMLECEIDEFKDAMVKVEMMVLMGPEDLATSAGKYHYRRLKSSFSKWLGKKMNFV